MLKITFVSLLSRLILLETDVTANGRRLNVYRNGLASTWGDNQTDIDLSGLKKHGIPVDIYHWATFVDVLVLVNGHWCWTNTDWK